MSPLAISMAGSIAAVVSGVKGPCACGVLYQPGRLLRLVLECKLLRCECGVRIPNSAGYVRDNTAVAIAAFCD